jgi:structural maintenance of chromosome 2
MQVWVAVSFGNNKCGRNGFSCCLAHLSLQSQFIVVSLKEGMFNNANVIFRTKFVDGVSTVTRTVNDSSTTAHGGGSGAARGARENAYAGGGGGSKASQRGTAGRQALRESNRS